MAEYYQRPGHVIAVGVALPTADLIAVGLRFWLRRRQRLPLRMDDWLIIPATALVVGFGICLVYGVSQEALAYPTKVPPESADNPFGIVTDQVSLASKIEYASTLMFILTLGCIKASFLFFYIRIFSVKKTLPYVLLASLITFVGLWTMAFLVATIFQCRLQVEALWGSVEDLMTKCVDTLHLILSLCITDFATDVFIIIFPIPLIWQLKLSTGKKIATSFVFLLGSVSIAASMTRLIVLADIIETGFAPGSDEILIITLYLYWGMVECGVGVLAACLPTLSSLVRGVTWDSIVTMTRSLISSQHSTSDFTNLEDQPIQTGAAANDSYKGENSISTKSLSRQRDPATSWDEPVPGAQSYAMHDRVKVRESV